MRHGLAAFVALIVTFAAAGERPSAQQLLEEIKKQTGVAWAANTVDTIKAGDPSTPVTGIATTMFPTLDVLKAAAASGHNLIICHEPTFYNHRDDLTPLEKDEVQVAKLKFIRENNLVVFRFHDHFHRMKPDGILLGTLEALGWRKYQRAAEPSVVDLPATTLGALARDIKEKLNAAAVRVVGDPKLPIAKVALSPGAAGTLSQIAQLQRDDIDVLVCGETREWETVEYTRDALSTGKKKGLILIGHSPSEEAGMKYCASWLSTFITSVPVKFMPCGDPFFLP